MKLKQLILKNFRGYKDKTVIIFDELTTFVGQNDIGKTTILEALDIFFNDKKAVNFISKDDFNINSNEKNMLIGTVFDNLPKNIIIDSEVKTTFKDEYLLNENKQLEIYKYYTGSGLSKVCINAYHPAHIDLKDLLNLKIAELQKKAKELNIEEKYNGKFSSSIRQAIRNKISDKKMENQLITVYKNKIEDTGGKAIWERLQEYLPTYSLFQSDRKNEEKDREVQTPMKAAIQRIIKDEVLQEKLSEIKDIVQKASQEIANSTISKLKEMNEEIADELKSNFEDPKWENAFNFTITSDDNIPLNKRGSGVRRLILLNFFRAEAERKRSTENPPSIIYGFEEPETSQHPNHQKMLIDAFMDLSKKDDTQIILTTHSPAIGRLLPVESLRSIVRDGQNLRISSSENGENIITEIADSLGILPNIKIENTINVNTAVCVEGSTDIEFLKNISQIPELKSIVDLKTEEKCILIFLGGSSIQYWVNNDYLKNLNLNEIHIYDSDSNSTEPKNRNKYRNYIIDINKRGGYNKGFTTNKAEIENYIHPELIEDEYKIKTCYKENDWLGKWDKSNPAKLVDSETKKIKEAGGTIKLVSERIAKKELCEILSKKLTKNHLEELDAFEEIKLWFEAIRESITNTNP
jgi:putative ATP-dependent endonuclease of the OLD family